MKKTLLKEKIKVRFVHEQSYRRTERDIIVDPFKIEESANHLAVFYKNNILNSVRNRLADGRIFDGFDLYYFPHEGMISVKIGFGDRCTYIEFGSLGDGERLNELISKFGLLN